MSVLSKHLATILSVVGFSTLAMAAPPQWEVLEDYSTVGFIVTQTGSPVEGVFEAFHGDIRFDPVDLANSRVRVVIDMNSINSQSSDRDSTIRSANLFDVATWPTAVYQATSFRAGDVAGQYVALGTLTMRDVTKDVTMMFNLSIKDSEAREVHATGSLDVLRLDYGIGQGMWANTLIVGNPVTITFDIRAVR